MSAAPPSRRLRSIERTLGNGGVITSCAFKQYPSERTHRSAGGAACICPFITPDGQGVSGDARVNSESEMASIDSLPPSAVATHSEASSRLINRSMRPAHVQLAQVGISAMGVAPTSGLPAEPVEHQPKTGCRVPLSWADHPGRGPVNLSRTRPGRLRKCLLELAGNIGRLRLFRRDQASRSTETGGGNCAVSQFVLWRRPLSTSKASTESTAVGLFLLRLIS